MQTKKQTPIFPPLFGAGRKTNKSADVTAQDNTPGNAPAGSFPMGVIAVLLLGIVFSVGVFFLVQGSRDGGTPLLASVLTIFLAVVAAGAMLLQRNRGRDLETALAVRSEELAAIHAQLADAQQKSTASEALSMQAETELAGAFKQLRESELYQMQSEKMSALGVMVAGVAHEINTPLGFVSSNVEFMHELTSDLKTAIHTQHDLMRDVPRWGAMSREEQQRWYNTALHSGKALAVIVERRTVEEMSELVDESTVGLERISEIVRSLKDFSRVDRAAVDSVDIHQGIDSTLVIAQNVLKNKAEVVKQYGQVPLISCNPSQINQVILNLVTNAAQAIPTYGQVTIATRTDGAYIAIDVIDNGAGMTEEVRSQVFKPFFTTKQTGEGTGLGLAICEKIVGAHKGTLSVESAVGVGTTFTIRLPIRAAA
jgi:two-component system, NtrC family, sensor kinase